jgi:hypothetical protein
LTRKSIEMLGQHAFLPPPKPFAISPTFFTRTTKLSSFLLVCFLMKTSRLYTFRAFSAHESTQTPSYSAGFSGSIDEYERYFALYLRTHNVPIHRVFKRSEPSAHVVRHETTPLHAMLKHLPSRTSAAWRSIARCDTFLPETVLCASPAAAAAKTRLESTCQASRSRGKRATIPREKVSTHTRVIMRRRVPACGRVHREAVLHSRYTAWYPLLCVTHTHTRGTKLSPMDAETSLCARHISDIATHS